MASKTPNLDLLKKDPVADGNDTFNIETMLNENWDKIDAAVGEVREELKEVHVPSATLTEPGIVQLSSATDSSSETLAATPKAVKSAYDAAVAAQNTANAANTAAATAQSTADNANSAAATAQNTANAVSSAVGPLSSLLTGTKSNTVAAINELFTNVSDGKNAIASAITGKGVVASGSDPFAVLAQKIGQISTGIKMASGKTSGSHNIRTITNLAFKPMILICNFNTELSLDNAWSYATAHIFAFDVGGGVIYGSDFSLQLSGLGMGTRNIALNLKDVVFGADFVQFGFRFQSGGTVSYYIFGV